MAIYLCADGHDEICHEGKTCPACEVIEERDQTIKDLEVKNSDLQEELDNATREGG